MNFRRPPSRGNATKCYGNPVMHKVFSPIFVIYHPLLPSHPFQKLLHPSEVQQLTRLRLKSPSRPEQLILS